MDPLSMIRLSREVKLSAERRECVLGEENERGALMRVRALYNPL